LHLLIFIPSDYWSISENNTYDGFYNLNYWVMHPVVHVSVKYWHTIDRQRLQHTHQNLHSTDRAKKPIINT
jgi:hypothetical protein